jgi:hypothetical protein
MILKKQTFGCENIEWLQPLLTFTPKGFQDKKKTRTLNSILDEKEYIVKHERN